MPQYLKVMVFKIRGTWGIIIRMEERGENMGVVRW